MQWQNGRELYMTYKNTSVKTFYAYGENGNRTIKNTNSAGGKKYLYYYAGDRLISQVWDDGAMSLNFLYDENGSPYGFVYKNVSSTLRYYYIKNLQGDVIALTNQYHGITAYYAYDAWGRILYIKDGTGSLIAETANHIANFNPIRYRSYYYDTETGFYYLNTRYYDPSIGRFINADGFVSTGQGFLSYNMYAYCENNPVMYVDYGGACYGYPNDPNLYSASSGVQWGYNCGNYGYHVRRPKNEKTQSPIIITSINPDIPPDHPSYKPPKKGGGTKVKNPNGNGKGWPDKNGDVWMPGPMHGGEGWTVQQPGGGHYHAYPGGHIRKATYYSQPFRGGQLILSGVCLGMLIIADDVIGIAVDEPLLPVASGFVIAGWDEIKGTYVCDCGESW